MRIVRSGFTVIELLAATAAMAIMVLAILNVIGLMSRDRLREKSLTSVTPGPVLRLFDQMRADFVSLKTMTLQTDNRPFAVDGLCGIDSKSFMRDARHSVVNYQLRGSAESPYLVRHQEQRSIEGKAVAMDCIALFDVKSLRIEPEHRKPAKPGDPPLPPRFCEVVLTLLNGQSYTQTLVLQ